MTLEGTLWHFSWLRIVSPLQRRNQIAWVFSSLCTVPDVNFPARTVYHFRASVIQAMLKRKMLEWFKEMWKKCHGGQEWCHERDVESLMNLVDTVGTTISVMAFKTVPFHKPMERWRIEAIFGSINELQMAHSAIFLHEDRVEVFPRWSQANRALLEGLELDDVPHREVWKTFAKQVTPVLKAIGLAQSEISCVLTQTDFAPSSIADSEKKALEALKGEGNKAFAENRFEDALEQYKAALEIANLKDDTQAILHSNMARCHLEISQFRHARKEAKLAMMLKPAWFKPYLWYYEACVRLEKYLDALDWSGVYPNAFPPEWRTEAEMRLKLIVISLCKAPSSEDEEYESSSTDGEKSDLGVRMEMEELEWQKGRMHQLRAMLVDRLIKADRGYACKIVDAESAIQAVLGTVLTDRGMEIPIPAPLVELAKTNTSVKWADRALIRMHTCSVDEQAEALELCEQFLRKYPDTWQVLEWRGLHKMKHRKDLEGALADISKALPLSDNDLILLRLEASLIWQIHLKKSLKIPKPGTPLSNPLVSPLAHIPMELRVPSNSMSSLLHFIQKAPSDHPHISAAHFELSHMYYVEDQVQLAKQFYDTGCEFGKIGIHQYTDPHITETRDLLEAAFKASPSV